MAERPESDGHGAVEPSWATLNAIDFDTGRSRWKVPLGESPGLVAPGLKDTDPENNGGPVATAGDRVLTAAAVCDRMLRAFDAKTGELLWQCELPYAGTAVPADCGVARKRYPFISASSAPSRSALQGSAQIAFSLR